MGNDVLRLSVIGQIIRRRRRLLCLLAAGGALLGGGASVLFSPGYESASSVLLQGPQDEQELLTQAHIATTSVVLDRTATALEWDITGAELRDSVRAEVRSGKVIEIRGLAPSPEQAQQLTDQLTREYVRFATELVSGAATASSQVFQERRQTLEQRITQSHQRITELQASTGPEASTAEARAELTRLRTELTDATQELDDITARELAVEADAAFGQAGMVVIEPALRPTGPAEPTPAQFVAGGALSMFLLGVFAHLVAVHLDHRLRRDSDIADALGAPVLAGVGVPDLPVAHPPPAGHRRRLARLWRLVCDDQPWNEPPHPIRGDDPDQDTRYRQLLVRLRGPAGQILARLRGTPDHVLRLLVVVADDDVTAHRAVARLAMVAATTEGPTSVVTSDADISALIQATNTARLTLRSSSDPAPGTDRTVLHVVAVCATSPLVAPGGRVSGALIVLTAGTRTGWELLGMAEACVDAGHPVLGALVAHRTGPVEHRPVPPARPASAESVPITRNGTALAGSP